MYAFRATRPQVSTTVSARVGDAKPRNVSASLHYAPRDKIANGDIPRMSAAFLDEVRKWLEDDVQRTLGGDGRPVKVQIRVVASFDYDSDSEAGAVDGVETVQTRRVLETERLL